MKQKSKIGVIFGGASHEKEISLESGRNVIYKLQTSSLYEPVPLFLSSQLRLYAIDQATLVCHATAEIEALLNVCKQVLWSDLALHVDFVFIALHGGIGENGSLQGALEMLEIPYNGSGVLTSALCMNKYKTNQFLSAQGFCTPKNLLIEKNSFIKETIDTIHLPYPLIVKPHDDGCSVLVQKVFDKAQLCHALEKIWNDGKEYALVEECINGMELTVGILGNEHALALPPSFCVTNDSILTIEEKFLPGAGENQTPAPLSESATAFVQKTIEAVFCAIEGSGYARIDCFYQDENISQTKMERLVILEINTLPGLTPATCIFHQAGEIGMRPLDFIEKIIDLGFQKHKKIEQKKIDTQINMSKNKSESELQRY